MNIFYLDKDTELCAKYHCDKHVVKMILEYAQIMSTTHRVLDGEMYIDDSGKRKIKRWSHDLYDNYLYKATHVNHPSTIWARESNEHYEWLYEMWTHLHNEYKLRYGKTHKSYRDLHEILKNNPINIPKDGFKQPPQAIPEDVHNKDSIIAYREYYKVHKKDIVVWKLEVPDWYGD